MNLYGFAGGDRINFSDPMGLSPCCVETLGVMQGIRQTADAISEAADAEIMRTANKGVPPDLIGARAAAGETIFTAAGRAAHRAWDAGEGFVKEFTLSSGRRADAVNLATRTVKELKPDNPAAIRRGAAQVSRYVKELAEEYGGVWKGIVETYKRTPPP